MPINTTTFSDTEVHVELVKEVITLISTQSCSNDQVNQVIDGAIAIHTAFPEKSQHALTFRRKFVLLLLAQEA